jgi:hypothetical protein
VKQSTAQFMHADRTCVDLASFGLLSVLLQNKVKKGHNTLSVLVANTPLARQLSLQLAKSNRRWLKLHPNTRQKVTFLHGPKFRAANSKRNN